jgi:hypothetical protein
MIGQVKPCRELASVQAFIVVSRAVDVAIIAAGAGGG